MLGQMDGLPGDEGAAAPNSAARVDERRGADPLSRDGEKTEDEKAETEIEAGDVADDLADFA